MITSYRDSVGGTRDRVTYQKLVTRSRYGLVRCTVGILPSHQRGDMITTWADVDGQRDTSLYPPSTFLHFFSFLVLLSWRVVRVCSAVWFLERFGDCEMVWTQESVIELIELYKRKEITWDPKHPTHFNKIRKQDAWEELGKEMNRPVDECKKKMEN